MQLQAAAVMLTPWHNRQGLMPGGLPLQVPEIPYRDQEHSVRLARNEYAGPKRADQPFGAAGIAWLPSGSDRTTRARSGLVILSAY